MNRTETRKITIGSTSIGHQNRVLIQSMCNIKTSNISKVVAQINECALAGADIMRVSILDEEDAKSIKEIMNQISIPLVADIHFDYKLALICAQNGISAIRINPGNIGAIENIKKVVEICNEKNIPIRIGVNSGSLDREISKNNRIVKSEELVNSAKKHVDILESLDFHNIVISLKGSNVKETIEAYKLASKMFEYPLHLGITEAGPSEIGIIRSVAGLSPLLLEGIGDTIRISLSDDPVKEVITAKRLLHDLGLYDNYPTFISCPTCGRTQVDLFEISHKVLKYLEDNKITITIAIMGCIVNGPGEACHADLGLAGGKNCYAIFKKGKVIKTVPQELAYDSLIEEIKNYLSNQE